MPDLFQTANVTYDGMKIIFEFPVQSFLDEEVKLEVKDIMAHVLHEQLMQQTQ